MKTLLVIVAISSICALSSPGQSNTPSSTLTQPQASQASPEALKVADDVRQLVVDLFILGSGVSWSGTALAAYLAIKGIRNRTSLGTGKFAPILNMLNLEAKNDFSQAAKLAPAADNKPQTIISPS
jgi:hypothetical protein